VDRARLGAPRLPHVLLLREDHRHPAGRARLAVEGRPARDLLERGLARLVGALAAAQHDVGARAAVRVEPVILGPRDVEREVIVRLAALTDQHVPALAALVTPGDELGRQLRPGALWRRRGRRFGAPGLLLLLGADAQLAPR